MTDATAPGDAGEEPGDEGAGGDAERDAAGDTAPVPTPEELFEMQYPQHGLVVANLCPVYHRAATASPRLGYLRKGARVRLGPAPVPGRGCAGGDWYSLPEKGFVCTKSLLVGVSPPQADDAPVQPDRDSVLPYRYAQNRHNRAYALSRLPTDPEAAEVRRMRDLILRADELWAAELQAAAGQADAGTGDARTSLVEMDVPEPDGEEPPVDAGPPVVSRESEFEHMPGDKLPDEETTPTPPPPPRGGSADAGTAVDLSPDEVLLRQLVECHRGHTAVYSLAGPAPGSPRCDVERLGGLVSQWLEKDFFVSVDRTVSAGGERLYRTLTGRLVPARFFVDVEPPTYRGLVIQPDTPLPIGFVGRSRPTTYRPGSGQRMQEAGRISRQSYRFLRTLEMRGNHGYWVMNDGLYVRDYNFGVAEEQAPPAAAGSSGKWVHIDLSEQLLVAYEGSRPVFAALVSSGKEGFATPAGEFRIVSKHVSATMDGITEADGAYSIEDVPWTMFFNSNFAIHGAFWHNRFGMTKSHGCVNMSPVDARWVFEWSEPSVPEGWHGALASDVQPGTPVIITE
jgi:lipoprotein-anchoring transpeptidase ErfK/SrfK